MIFAEGQPEWLSTAANLVQSFGPAGIAAVALWWFGNRQEKRDAVLVKLHDDAVIAGDKRLDSQLLLETKRIDLMDKMVDKFSSVTTVFADATKAMTEAVRALSEFKSKP